MDEENQAGRNVYGQKGRLGYVERGLTGEKRLRLNEFANELPGERTGGVMGTC